MQFRWGNRKQQRGRSAGLVQRVLAIVSALAMSIGLVAVTATAAQADTPGITVEVVYNGQVVDANGSPQIPEGAPFSLIVRYNGNEDIDGKSVVISLPADVSVTSVPGGNTAVESVTQNPDGTYTVKFKDEVPADVAEGGIEFKLKANQTGETKEEVVSWQIGDDQGSTKLIIEHTETPPHQVTEAWGKSVNPGTLSGYFEFQLDENGDYVFSGLKDSILERDIAYTLTIDSPEARSGYAVADQLPAGLGYVAGSFAANLRTYNPTADEAYAFAPTIAGNSFSGTVDVPENSTLTITYKVRVTDKSVLEDLIRAAYEGKNPNTWTEIGVKNTATYGGDVTREATVKINGQAPGVGIGQAFAKDGEWTEQNVVADADKNLVPPAEMTYTLKADLTKWTGEGNNFTLTQNVVISDTLIDQASWKTGDAEFVTADAIALTSAGACPATDVAFQDDQYAGKYCVAGKTLMINVGKDTTKNVTVKVKAQLDSVAGLTAIAGGTPIVGGAAYPWNNTASFRYSSGNPYTDKHDAKVVVLPEDYEGGINDSRAFSKTGPAGDVKVDPGETAEVPYTFTIDTSRGGIDPLKSKIVDEVDTTIFDLSDVASIPVSGSYDGTALTAEHFTVTKVGDNHLTIELSEAGKTLVGSKATGKQWIVNIKLTTRAFDGKETLEIHNKATLYGEDNVPQYWSTEDSEATSYGDEAEVRKRVYDAETGTWVPSIQALIDGGEFVDDTFYYRIEFIPRGNYGSAFPVKIFTVNDQLPASVQFAGFVSVDENEAPGAVSGDGPVDISGNLQAEYADGKVSISQKAGTNLNPDQGKIAAYFAVTATDASDDIVNRIGNTDATIEPVGDPSIDIEKWNDEGDQPEYDETGALQNDGFDGDFDEAPGKGLKAGEPLPIHFTISNDGREDLVDVAVSDELTDGSGEIQDLECTFPDDTTGVEWAGPFAVGTQFSCTGTLPALEGGDTHSDTAQVVGTGIASGKVVDDADDWHGNVPQPSIDIEKWNDEGSAPEYDETGALQNDGFDGDFDGAPGKSLKADATLPIHFTISNDGVEDLVNVKVSDELTDGTGEIQDLVCTFPDDSTGVEWAGPFAVGTQFECTGSLPALSAGEKHADTAQVTGTGRYSGTDVDDADEWHGFVAGPSIDIEKWNDEGDQPEYDEAGVLLNNGFDGDFDQAPGKKLDAGKDQEIRFTISNDGDEDLVNVKVSDELTSGKGRIGDLVCTFPDDSTGTEWAGPFAVGTQFECTGTLPALLAGDTHSDTAKVFATGIDSGVEVDDSDDWHGTVPKDDLGGNAEGRADAEGNGSNSGLSNTGAQLDWILGAAVALMLAGGGVLVLRRRKQLGAE